MTNRPCIARITLLRWFIPIVFLSLFPIAAIGEGNPGSRAFQIILRHFPSINPGFNKVSPSLKAVIDKAEARGITRQTARALRASTLSNPLVRVNNQGNIQTYIHVDAIGNAERAMLETYEVIIEIVNESLGIIQAWIPLDRIEEVAELPFVKRITPPIYATPRTGSVITEGDAILNADEVRALGFDGSGVKVGVIGPGVDSLALSQTSGDLPSNVTTVTHTNTGDEGTAMLEIIHDLAPGAELGFCGPDTSLEMIACVNELAGAFGADIIMDDLGFFGEPYFEDGPVAKAVANVASSVVYVSAAGNDAETHYEADFRGTSFLDVFAHDFGSAAGLASDPTMDVAIAPGATLTVVLQWADPSDESANDYDLYLLNEAESTTLESSSFTQDGDDDPLEALFYTNATTGQITVKVVIDKFSGEDKRLEMFLLNPGSILIEYPVPEGSIFGHPAVPGALAIGAIDASDPGNDDIESFSSRGPSTIFFPAQETRQKPDITAIDGVSVTGVGGFPSPSSNTFFGTSAAAPHVAGIAALLKSVSPTAQVDEIIDVLKNKAVDMGDAGTDNTYGAGRIDALATFEPNSEIDTPTGDVTIMQRESVQFTGTGNDFDGSEPLTFLWDFGGGATNATEEDPGPVTFNTAGTFTVTFTVTDSLGLTDSTPDTLTITVVNTPPDGLIDTPADDLLFIHQGDSVNFTGTGVDSDGNLPLSFLWDFGGGATNATDEDPGPVAFNTAGIFTVTFTVTDSLGLADPTPDTRTIRVRKSNSSDGGGCTMSALEGKESDVFILLLGISGVALLLRRNRQ